MLQPSPIVKRTIVLHGNKTSVSLEPDFWAELKREAASRRTTLSALVHEIDQARTHGNLSSACRCHVLARAQNK
jgi:predicted DNA-binding ribbon-helix-helix protein